MSNYRLDELFARLQNNPKDFLAASSGEDFERQMMRAAHDLGYNRITPDEIDPDHLSVLKDGCDHFSSEQHANPTPNLKHYIHQLRGKQDYPDLLFLAGGNAVAVEVKFVKERSFSPMWNSGLPRQNGIYVFGSYRSGIITFFRGADVISEETARQMHDELNSYQKKAEKFNRDVLCSEPYGWSIYPRKAFNQAKKYNPEATVDLLRNPHRQDLEQKVIDYCRNLV